MRTLDEILAISIERKGSEQAVFDGFQPSKSSDEIAAIPDDRWLAEMTRAIFQAGFNWKVVDRMWLGFETAFAEFDIGRNAMMSDDRFDELCKDTSIVRYPQKIQSVQKYAVYFQEVANEHGIDMRTAAFVLAIRRVGKAALARQHIKTELPF